MCFQNREQMSKELEADIAGVIDAILQPYLQQFHEWRIEQGPGYIEVKGRVGEKDAGKTLVLRVNFSHDGRQVQIPNIFMPSPMMRGQGIGKQVIAAIREALEKYGYQLFIVDLVPSFYDRLIKRGAVCCEEGEVVLITDKTRLT